MNKRVIQRSFQKLMMVSAFLLGFAHTSFALDYTLTWDPDPPSNVDHFVIYWRTSSGSYNDVDSIQVTIDKTSETVTVPDGDYYYLAMKSFDSQDRASSYSDEVYTGNVITTPSAGFKASSADYQAFIVSGTTAASSSVEVFEGGVTSLGTTTADGSGEWTINVDLSSFLEGAISLTAVSNAITSTAVAGTLDITAPSAPTSLTVQ